MMDVLGCVIALSCPCVGILMGRGSSGCTSHQPTTCPCSPRCPGGCILKRGPMPRLAATGLKGKQLEMGEKRSITSRDKFAISKWCCIAGRVCGRCSQLSVNENHFIFCYLNMSSPPTQNNMRAFPGRTD